MPLLTYREVQTQLGTGRAHLLLGNGFSIACDPVFNYQSLFEFAQVQALSGRIKEVFTHLGTNNFEGVMRLLEEGAWLAGHYSTPDDARKNEMLADLARTRQALVEAIADTHLTRPLEVPETRLASCRAFLTPYYNIFTLNYDLLLYWVCMSVDALRRRDCFGNSPDDPDAPYCVFNHTLGDQAGMLFLHGALHLYLSGGQVRKHTWSRTGVALIDSVRDALNAGQYPLFVAEGSADKKKSQIEASSYLSYCLSKFGRIQGRLVLFGWGLGDSDRHILDAIVFNTKLSTLFVGLYGDDDSPAKQQIRATAESLVQRRNEVIARQHGRGETLEVFFFNTQTAAVWGP